MKNRFSQGISFTFSPLLGQYKKIIILSAQPWGPHPAGYRQKPTLRTCRGIKWGIVEDKVKEEMPWDWSCNNQRKDTVWLCWNPSLWASLPFIAGPVTEYNCMDESNIQLSCCLWVQTSLLANVFLKTSVNFSCFLPSFSVWLLPTDAMSRHRATALLWMNGWMQDFYASSQLCTCLASCWNFKLSLKLFLAVLAVVFYFFVFEAG